MIRFKSLRKKYVVAICVIILIFIAVVLIIICNLQRSCQLDYFKKEINKDTKELSIMTEATNLQKKINVLLDNSIDNTYYNKIYFSEEAKYISYINGTFVDNNPEVVSKLNTCAAIAHGNKMTDELSYIQKNESKLNDTDKKGLNIWLNNAVNATGGLCFLSYYVIDDSKIKNAMNSKNSIDYIQKRANAVYSDVNNLKVKYNKLKNQKVIFSL